MAVLEFDDEATKRLLAVYITPDIVEQRTKFKNELNPQPGERILDVGAGPGYLVSIIAEDVGKSGYVCGLDISAPLLEVARSQSREVSNIEFIQGDATELPFPNESFDAVVSTQVLEYVADIDSALSEFNRVLRKGGRVALLDTDWDSIVWHSSNRDRMRRMLTAWEKHAADPFLPRTLVGKLEDAGFQPATIKIIPLLNDKFDPNTYSNRMIDLILPFVIEQGEVSKSDAVDWAVDLRERGGTGEYFFSLIRYYFQARKL